MTRLIAHATRKAFVIPFLIVICSAAQHTHAAEMQVVGFDVPSIIVAQRVLPKHAQTPLAGGTLVRIQIPVSTFVSSDFRGQLGEYLVELESPTQTMRILDFWPRHEVYSDIEGPVSVKQTSGRVSEFSLNASAGVNAMAKGTASGKLQHNSATEQSYQRRAPVHVLTSSGTIRRGYGAFFKFHLNRGDVSQAHLSEGAKEIAILAEVPRGWRADMLLVSFHATGRPHNSRKSVELGKLQLWTTLHLEGDRIAAQRARNFVKCEQALVRVASLQHDHVAKRSYPTFWHKIGASLDLVEPRIPSDYLTKILFGPCSNHLAGGQQRLPVDVRVAALDYWDSRRDLQEFASGRIDNTSSDTLARVN